MGTFTYMKSSQLTQVHSTFQGHLSNLNKEYTLDMNCNIYEMNQGSFPVKPEFFPALFQPLKQVVHSTVQIMLTFISLLALQNMFHFIFQFIRFPPSGLLRTHNCLLSCQLDQLNGQSVASGQRKGQGSIPDQA